MLLSDLHLPVEPSPYRDTFRAFLSGPARGASALYLLGDLFNAWVGDDIGVADFAAECAALRALAATGVAVYFMRGNRDFLIGAEFARTSGVALLEDPVVVTLPDGPALLSHGDLLCTDDRAYQRYRRVTHNRVVMWCFLHLPSALRRAITQRLRAASLSRNARARTTPAPVGDVNETAVRACLTAHGAIRLIHGHTHRPGDHGVTLETGTGRRFVLADWRPERMEYLECSVHGWRRIKLTPISATGAAP
ncbi:MAG: UDP-2,3-diacylglucosamine diphosphatase [Nevskiaceae bacterium]|nr:MAG: UDP-2,3-diacylglucosamine diphosphatase [Nevskiaceae bacterium]TBR74895.1 MAG: UDP-2,3-diacylglucosamine diphosphatase [Nevskiaceae bacterium]